VTIPVRVGVGLNPFEAFDLGRWWAQVDLIEELGYDSVWLPESATLPGVAPLPALAAVAARTERLKLGTSVLVLPARNPVLLARELATIDAVSNGRLLPAGGLGLGLAGEAAALGVARDERTARLEEVVRIVKALWPGEPVTLEGRFWVLDGVRLTPRPRRRKLEFWLGGRAPAALRRLGRIADGWLASGVAPEDFAAHCEVIRASAREADRSIDEDHYGASIFAAPNEEELAAHGAPLTRLDSSAGAIQIACGTGALRDLLERFVESGASKFVVTPVARDPLAWLRELYAEVVAPLEARTA
jgi:probable F420-dependent oxidoreductase